MGSETEPAKLLLPYLQRADELQKHEPLVAYYCRLYAMERGLKIQPKERTKTTNSLLVSLMKQLEKDKKSLKLGPEDSLYVEGFASNVFAKADKQDRAGRADLNTAKTFYAASIFFEILNQFGELQPDIEQKQKYAVWKAAEIRKALKEGRRPEPGPPGGDKDLSIPSSSPTSTHDLERSQSFPASQPADAMSSQHVDKDMKRNESFQAAYPGADITSQDEERANPHVLPQAHPSTSSFPSHDVLPQTHTPPTSYPSHDVLPQTHTPPTSYPSHDVLPQTHSPPSSYPSHDYPSNNFHQPPQVDRPEIPSYHETYHHQPYSSEQQPPQNYYSHENPSASYSYPNFQSYPSFSDSTFPPAPTHQPSFYQGPDASYSNHSAPPASNFPPTVQYDSSSHNGDHAEPAAPPASSYNYDSNYQPPVEKIAEAHKAARFAVGALAFDDVAVAVDFLRRSLELLTNPSAETH